MPELSGEGVESWTFARLLSCVTDTPGRAPRRFMLWLESVIGTALWCWWQVPARRVNGASGRFELDWRLGALAAQSHFDDRVSMGRQSAPYWKAENTLST